MKSEHRHDLKTNELGRITSGVTRASEKYVHEHTNQLVIAIVAVIAIGIGVIYWVSASGSSDREGWRELSAATSADGFGKVAAKFPGTKVAQWARLREGEADLYSG